jgi:glycosyltransferase involved in cell wall biosynthesis
MKVAFIQPWASFGPNGAGGSLGIWTWEVGRRLAQVHEIVAYSNRSAGEVAYEEAEGVKFVRASPNLDLRLLRLRQRARQNLERDFASKSYYWFYLMRASIVLRRYGCDIIHIFNLSQFVPMIARLNPQAKIVLNMQCDWLAGLEHAIINKRLKYVDGIVGCANCITDDIRDRFAHCADRCVTIYNGADLNIFCPRADEQARLPSETVITVGRISPEKGLHVLLDAFEMVVAKNHNAVLRIIGPEDILDPEVITKATENARVRKSLAGYGNRYLRALQKRLTGSLRGKVAFVGALSPGQISAEMQNAAILVQPSIYDLFPLPVVEAMASGLPVVASRVGGIPEIVLDGETGLLVDPDNPIQLAEALLSLLDDPPKRRTMGGRGLARVIDGFSWEATVRELESFYETLQGCSAVWRAGETRSAPPSDGRRNSHSRLHL